MAKKKKWKAKKMRVAAAAGRTLAIKPGFASMHGAYIEAVQAEAEADKKR